jgi:Mn-containing catalase
VELVHVELVNNGIAMLNNRPGEPYSDTVASPDVSLVRHEAMKDIRLAAGFPSNGGGATPGNAQGISWNNDFVATTDNLIFDLLHNLHLECSA